AGGGISTALLLVSLTILSLTCCGACALLIATWCCGNRRQDTVGERGEPRWLPGVGLIDYVPASNRSSVRISLILPESPSTESRDVNNECGVSNLPDLLVGSQIPPAREENTSQNSSNIQENCLAYFENENKNNIRKIMLHSTDFNKVEGNSIKFQSTQKT
ncbi:unnamed protein product, partial [Meganyctiphanes norvegica]